MHPSCHAFVISGMLYTIRPHHDYRYDTKNYLRGYEDTYRPMSDARLRDKIAVDYLCFDRAVKESGIDLSGKFKGSVTMRTFIDELKARDRPHIV